MGTEIVLSEGKFTDQEIQLFEEQYLSVMQGLAAMAIEKKRLEEAEKKAKTELEKVMDQYSIISMDNQFIKVTRVAATSSKTIDVKELEKKEPELYNELLADYPKETKRAGYVRFTAK